MDYSMARKIYTVTTLHDSKTCSRVRNFQQRVLPPNDENILLQALIGLSIPVSVRFFCI